VDGHRDKLTTVFGDKFITLTVVCVQHSRREAPRRAGLSAAVETCYLTISAHKTFKDAHIKGRRQIIIPLVAPVPRNLSLLPSLLAEVLFHRRLFVCLFVNKVTKKHMGVFSCDFENMHRLYTRDELIKLWKVRVRTSGYGYVLWYQYLAWRRYAI